MSDVELIVMSFSYGSLSLSLHSTKWLKQLTANPCHKHNHNLIPPVGRWSGRLVWSICFGATQNLVESILSCQRA